MCAVGRDATDLVGLSSGPHHTLHNTAAQGSLRNTDLPPSVPQGRLALVPTPAYTLWQHCCGVLRQPGQAGKCSFSASHCWWVCPAVSGYAPAQLAQTEGRLEEPTGQRILELILESEFNVASTEGECKKQTQSYGLQAWLDPGDRICFCVVALLWGPHPWLFRVS